MTAKQYLNQIRNLDLRIQSSAEEVMQLRALTENITASFSERVQSSSAGDGFAEIVAKIADLEIEINAMTDELILKKQRVNYEMHNMKNNLYAALLIERYCNGKTWDQIANNLNYDIRYIQKLHGRALQEFAEKNSSVLK